MNFSKKLKSGESIIEILLYALIVSGLILTFFLFFNNLFSFFNKKEAQREVLSEVNFLMSRLGHYIENAKSIIEPSSSGNYIYLESFNDLENPSRIYLENENILVRVASSSPQILNSNRIKIDSLNFFILKNNNVPSSVRIDLVSSFNNVSARQELDFSVNLSSTFTLKGK